MVCYNAADTRLQKKEKTPSNNQQGGECMFLLPEGIRVLQYKLPAALSSSWTHIWTGQKYIYDEGLGL